MSDLEFLKKYEDLLNKDYCNCNEMNCIDNNSPRRILNIAKNQNKEIERLNNIINEIESIIYADISSIECRILIQEKLDKLKGEYKEGSD